MEPFVIKSISIRATGDPSVGIPGGTINIEEVNFDLGCLDEEDRENTILDMSEDLQGFAEIIFDERCSVWFFTEQGKCACYVDGFNAFARYVSEDQEED